MSSASVAVIVAHQGGWDEGLFVAGPLLVIIGLLWLAKRRTATMDHNLDHTSHEQPGPKQPSPERAGIKDAGDD